MMKFQTVCNLGIASILVIPAVALQGQNGSGLEVALDETVAALDHLVQIQGKLDGWYFGNLLFGGLIGMVIVDPITGAMYRLEKSYILDCTPASLD